MFNTREIATGIWLLAFFGWALSKAEVRNSFGSLLLALLNRAILIPLGLMAGYTALSVWLLWSVGLWNQTLLKDAVVWYLFSGLVVAMEYATFTGNIPVFKKAIADNLKAVLLIEFIVNTYTMPLWAELVLVPVATMLGLMVAYSEGKDEYKQVEKLMSALAITIGLALLGFAIWSAAADLQALESVDTLRAIAFPLLMSLLFVPLLYALLLWVGYEKVFLRLNCGREKPREVVRYAKKQSLLKFGLRLDRVNTFLKCNPSGFIRVQTTEDVDEVLNFAE